MICHRKAFSLFLRGMLLAVLPLTAQTGNGASSGPAYSFKVLLKTGDSVEGNKITGILDAPISNNRGEVVFTASFPDGSGIITPEKVLTRSGSTVDGKKLTYTAYPALNDSGKIVFLAGYGNASGLFSGSDLLATTGAGIQQHPVMNFNAGTAVNSKGVSAAEVQFGMYAPNGAGIIVASPGSPAKLVATSGGSINGKQISGFGPPVLNDKGVLAFRSDFFNPSDPNDTGILTVDSNSGSRAQLLIASGDAVAGKTLTVFGYPSAVTSSGRVVVPANFVGGSGIFSIQVPAGPGKTGAAGCVPEKSRLLVQAGETVSGKKLTRITQASMNDRRELAYLATFSNGMGLFGPVGMLIQTGETISGHSLTYIMFNHASFNNRREIVFAGQLSDGSRAVILGTPIAAARALGMAEDDNQMVQQ